MWRTIAVVLVDLAVGCAAPAPMPASPVGWTPPREAQPGRVSPQPPNAHEAPPAQSKPEASEAVTERGAEAKGGGVSPPPEEGVAESQGRGQGRVEGVIALAAQQIERLRQLEGSERDVSATPTPAVESSRVELESRRERVLQDLRAFELEPVGRSADLQTQLERDVGDLKRAIDASYEIVPPPPNDLSKPAPASPKELP